MRRVLPALVLALGLPACFTDTLPPADAGDAAVVDVSADTPAPTDQGAPADTGPLDAGSAVDVSPAADADASLPPGDDGSAMDAGHDAGPADAGQLDTGVDTGPGDTGGDAGADAGVVVVDAGRDAGVDVPRDVGVDAGPVTYDLEAERTGLEVRVVYRVVGRGGQTADCTSPPTSASCSVTESDNTLRFNVGSCGDARLVGLVPLGRPGRLVQMLYTGNVTNVVDPPLRRGAVRGGRQSFHIQASAMPTTQGEGIAGILGRTVDPALGDLWLLGCSVM